jgi:hypothetical protein
MSSPAVSLFTSVVSFRQATSELSFLEGNSELKPYLGSLVDTAELLQARVTPRFFCRLFHRAYILFLTPELTCNLLLSDFAQLAASHGGFFHGVNLVHYH